MEYATYTPDQVIINFGSIIVKGFAKDTFVEAERDEATFMKYVGSLGDVARSRNLNKAGKVTITLMDVSATNDDLFSLAWIDEDGNNGTAALSITDLNGNMRCRANIAWVEKWPKVERGKESGTIQWVIDCADLEIIPGGHGVPGETLIISGQ